MKLTVPHAILFDWDNTLVDTWPIIHEALHYTFNEMQLKPWTLEDVKAKVRKSMRDSFPIVFGENWEAAGQVYQDYYKKTHLDRLTALKGSEDTLKYLHDKDVFVGVVSNKKGPNLRKEVTHLGWDRYFDVIVGADDAARDKPFTDPVLLALEKSHLKGGPDIWFVGDSEIDLECAENVGCTAFLYGDVEHDGGKYMGFPFHHHVRDHEALLALLRQVWK